MIPERGSKRSAYLTRLRKERLNSLGRLLVDTLEELFETHDSAGTVDERTKVEKAIGEIVGRMATADKAAESEAIVRMKELAEARQKQANAVEHLH